MNGGNVFKMLIILFVLVLVLLAMAFSRVGYNPEDIINFIKETWNIENIIGP